MRALPLSYSMDVGQHHIVGGAWLILCRLQFQLQRESLSPEETGSVQEHLGYCSDSLLFVRITGRKPNFEVGSSSQLKLPVAKKSSGETGLGALF